MINKYSIKGMNEEHCAKARLNSASVSTKHCLEICSLIRKKNLQKAKALLQNSIDGKKPIPFKRYTGSVGHRKGDMTSGRYVVKACSEMLRLLNSVEANAQFKGLNASDLIIAHICANKASTPWRYGRQARRKAKRTTIEVVVKEAEQKKKEPAKKTAEPKKNSKPVKAEKNQKPEQGAEK